MINTNEKLIHTIIDTIDWEEVCNPERMFSEEDLSALIEFLPVNLKLRTGVSKCVLIPELENFVIKLPFLYCTDDDTGEVIELHNAPFCGNDYCYAEYEYYSLARTENLGCFFPKTVQYCTYPYHIYLQEKCITESNTKFYRLTSEQRQFINSLDILKDFSYRWLYECYNWYGMSALYKLHQFLKYYKITDFHADNYGYRISDHSPVLIDFSGFDY